MYSTKAHRTARLFVQFVGDGKPVCAFPQDRYGQQDNFFKLAEVVSSHGLTIISTFVEQTACQKIKQQEMRALEMLHSNCLPGIVQFLYGCG
jgi:hypothetical protein